jgi:hypothetical protein
VPHPFPAQRRKDAPSSVAIAISKGFARGLSMIDDLGASGELDDYYLFDAARADLLRRLGRRSEAALAYQSAISRHKSSRAKLSLPPRPRSNPEIVQRFGRIHAQKNNGKILSNPPAANAPTSQCCYRIILFLDRSSYLAAKVLVDLSQQDLRRRDHIYDPIHRWPRCRRGCQ